MRAKLRPWHFYPIGTGRVLCHAIGDPLWTAEETWVTCKRCLASLRRPRQSKKRSGRHG